MRFAWLLAGMLIVQGVFTTEKAQAADSADCRGVVLDENGVPVVAAQVKLEDSDGHAYRTETDLAGRFAIHNVSSGDYKAEVHKKGFFVLSGETVRDRKSTRLNSSHVSISYAVFCLKKK